MGIIGIMGNMGTLGSLLTAPPKPPIVNQLITGSAPYSSSARLCPSGKSSGSKCCACRQQKKICRPLTRPQPPTHFRNPTPVPYPLPGVTRYLPPYPQNKIQKNMELTDILRNENVNANANIESDLLYPRWFSRYSTMS